MTFYCFFPSAVQFTCCTCACVKTATDKMGAHFLDSSQSLQNRLKTFNVSKNEFLLSILLLQSGITTPSPLLDIAVLKETLPRNEMNVYRLTHKKLSDSCINSLIYPQCFLYAKQETDIPKNPTDMLLRGFQRFLHYNFCVFAQILFHYVCDLK